VKAEKTALLMAYRFPPQGGGGSLRTLKFTKYLREFGWEPVVHTARDPFWPVTVETLLHDVPEGVHVGARVGSRWTGRAGKRHDGRGSARPCGPRSTGGCSFLIPRSPGSRAPSSTA